MASFNQNTELENRYINYVKLGQLFTELGFLPMNLGPDSIERELLFDVWNIMKGEENNGVTLANILTVLFAIQGIDPALINENHKYA